MKITNFLLSLIGLFSAYPLWAQEASKLTRLTTGFEVGSGVSGQDCCEESYGNYKIGTQMAYRVSRLASLEGSLHFFHMEGTLYRYSNFSQYQLGGFQSWNNTILMLGPSFHFASKKSREWSFSPKAGIMMNNISKEIRNYGKPYLDLVYKPAFQMTYEAQLRLSWWFTERLALEGALGYFLSDGDKLKPKTDYETSPLPENFKENLLNSNGAMHALNISMGLRYRW